MSYRFSKALAVVCVSLVACKVETTSRADTPATQPSAAAAWSSSPLTPDPGGKVVVVEMTSDDKGSYFSPAEVTAKKGDVIRFTLKLGVHNVHFLADSNSGKSGYPTAPSDMLQLPGQSYDLPVRWEPVLAHRRAMAALGPVDGAVPQG